METCYCEPKKCSKKNSCNRHTIKNEKLCFITEKIGEDLSDICKSERLFIPGNKYSRFNNKEYYFELLNFFDNICEGDNCSSCEKYSNELYLKEKSSSRIECKKGDEFICKHNAHPDNRSINGVLNFIKAVDEAFKQDNIEFGQVSFNCPICGGEAWAMREDTPESIVHTITLRSKCEKCGFLVMN